MRIRKHASKLQGPSLSLYPSPCQLPPPPEEKEQRPWDPTASAAAAAGFQLCEVNRSPWDVMPADLHHALHLLQGPAKEEDNAAVGNGIGGGAKYHEEPISPVITSEADTKETGEGKKDKKKIRRSRKKKEKGSDGDTAVSTAIVVYCKKSDGKGWHCKRPALLPHSLCQYHLTQVRSYNYSHKAAELPAAATLGRDRNGRKKKVDSGDSTNFYYYYSGFGPWRGKRRGGGGDTTKDEEEGGGGDHEEDRRGENSQSAEDYDAVAVAGANEEAIDQDATDAAAAATGAYEEASDEDDRGNYDSDDSEESSDGGKEKRKKCRKRGRRPVKARSLKSLL